MSSIDKKSINYYHTQHVAIETCCDDIAKIFTAHANLHKKLDGPIFNISILHIKTLLEYEIYKFSLDEFTGYISVSISDKNIDWNFCVANKVVDFNQDYIYLSLSIGGSYKLFRINTCTSKDRLISDLSVNFKTRLANLFSPDIRHSNDRYPNYNENILYGYDICCDDILQNARAWPDLNSADQLKLFQHYKSAHADNTFDNYITECHEEIVEELDTIGKKDIEILKEALHHTMKRVSILEKTVETLTEKNKKLTVALNSIKLD